MLTLSSRGQGPHGVTKIHACRVQALCLSNTALWLHQQLIGWLQSGKDTKCVKDLFVAMVTTHPLPFYTLHLTQPGGQLANW